MEQSERVFAGIDWANETHVVWAADANGRRLGEREVPHQGKGLAEMVAWLVALAEGEAEAVAVAIETPHGPIVDTLLDRGCHVFAINPKQLDRFRDRFSPAGAKDDRRDAEVLSSAVRTDPGALRRLSVTDPLTLQLREASRQDAELEEDLQRLVNRLRDLLVRAWPEVLRLAPAANEAWFWTLLGFAATPDAGAKLSMSRIRRILRDHRIRRIGAEELAAVLRTPSVYLAPGVREGVAPRIADLLEQIWVLHAQRQQSTKRLETVLQALADAPPEEKSREHQDVEIIQSLPGIGIRIAATMLAEAAQALRDRDYHGLRTLTGAAPVTKRSGKRRMVQMRRACQDRLRDALHYWGMGAIQHDPSSKAHYAELRAKGHSHGRAVRGVIDRLLNVLIAMLRDGTLYDATRRRAAAATA